MYYCTKAGVSPNAVVKELGLSSGSVTAWKNGTTPRTYAVVKIAEYFSINVEDLISFKENEVVERIKNLSAERGTSLNFMYKKLGLPSGYLRDINAGKTSFTENRLSDIADFLNTSSAYLKGETNKREDADYDIILERILSLIPKKGNGNFKHGALKEFANSVGLKSGNLITDWIKGRSNSYKNYVYEISNKYNVSVDWLTGKTDTKEKAAPLTWNDLSAENIKFLKAVDLLNPAMRRTMIALSALDQEELERFADLAESFAKLKER